MWYTGSMAWKMTRPGQRGPAAQGVVRYLPLRRMEVGQLFFIPPEMMEGGEKRYHSVRQAVYRWGYRNGWRFKVRREKGGLWVKRIEDAGSGEQPEKSEDDVGGLEIQDSSVSEPGVSEAHPVGAG